MPPRQIRNATRLTHTGSEPSIPKNPELGQGCEQHVSKMVSKSGRGWWCGGEGEGLYQYYPVFHRVAKRTQKLFVGQTRLGPNYRQRSHEPARQEETISGKEVDKFDPHFTGCGAQLEV